MREGWANAVVNRCRGFHEGMEGTCEGDRAGCADFVIALVLRSLSRRPKKEERDKTSSFVGEWGRSSPSLLNKESVFLSLWSFCFFYCTGEKRGNGDERDTL